MQGKRRAFTLVELLTVIAIIAVLSALLFPVFLAARQAVDRYGSASQLRQLGMSVSMYAADHDDSIPPYRALGWWGPDCPISACLNPDFRADYERHGSVAREWYGEFARDTVFFSQIIANYVKSDKTFKSKGQPLAWVGADRQGVSYDLPEHRSYGAQNSYALNWFLFSNPVGSAWTGGGLAMSQIDKTSGTALMMDGSFYLALPRYVGPLIGNWDATSIVCEGNFPRYWKNIGNSSLFGRGGEPDDESALLLGDRRYGGMLVVLMIDGSTKMKPYKTVLDEFRSANKESFWDPYKLGHEPCPPID